MNIEQLFRSLNAQPQEPAPAAVETAAPAAQPAAANESAPAKIEPIASQEASISRWPIFRSHATPWETSAPLSDDEKKHRLEPAEQSQVLKPPNPPADNFVPKNDADIAQALKRLVADIRASSAQQPAAVAKEDAANSLVPIDPAAGLKRVPVNLATAAGLLLQASPVNTSTVDSSSVCAASAGEPFAQASPNVAKAAGAAVAQGGSGHDGSLVSLFDRLRGQPAQTSAGSIRRRSLASSRMMGR